MFKAVRKTMLPMPRLSGAFEAGLPEPSRHVIDGVAGSTAKYRKLS